MTISTQASTTTVFGNSVTTQFTFNFVYDSSDNILVSYTDSDGVVTLLSPSQYNLSLNPPLVGQIWGVGGTVTYPTAGSPISSTEAITITRVLPLVQTTSISNQGDFYPTVVEEALDTLELQIQQISARGGQFRFDWVTNADYNYGDMVIDGANGNNTGNLYLCIIANVSGVWSTDLSDGEWYLIWQAATTPLLPLPVGVAIGGTGADLSATGGTGQVVKQTTLGGAFTVSALAASDLSNGTTGSGSIVLATSPTLASPVITTGSLTTPTLTTPVFSGIPTGTVTSGTYTPTLTNVSNVASNTAYVCQYSRVGDTVTVSGNVGIDPTAAAQIDLGMSLPIASNLASTADLGGTALSFTGTLGQSTAIFADTVNDRANLRGLPSSTADATYAFSFTYRII